MEPAVAIAKKTLFIDYDSDIREIIHMILDMAGFEVGELDNAHEVAAAINKFHPDVMLGDMDGRDICKQLKSEAETRTIPIIIISATRGQHSIHEKMCGANEYLAKPFDIDKLNSSGG